MPFFGFIAGHIKSFIRGAIPKPSRGPPKLIRTDDVNSFAVQYPWTLGGAGVGRLIAVQVLEPQALRTGYRVISDPRNLCIIYHDYDGSRISRSSPDYILPGGVLEDVGSSQTIHQGEVWVMMSTVLSGDTDNIEQKIFVEEVTAWKKSSGFTGLEGQRT